MVFRGDISIGVLRSVFDLIGYIIGPTVYFPFILNGLNRSAASIDRISGLTSLPQAVLKPAVKSPEPSVKLKDVSFSYEDGSPVLSGGQKQRIAIARAILRDAPVLLLDEISSALDSETEMRIFGTVKELAKTKTVLFITHN